MKKTLIILAIFLSVSIADASTFILSDFEDGTFQGWTPEQFFGGELIMGSGSGYMAVVDTVAGGGGLWVRAPEPFLGDMTKFAGIQWDEYLYNSPIYNTSVILEGADGTRYQSPGNLEKQAGVWFTRSVTFDPGNWNLRSGTGSFESVTEDVHALFINMDVSWKTWESAVDNIGFFTQSDSNPPAPVPEPATLNLLAAGLIGFAGINIKRVKKK